MTDKRELVEKVSTEAQAFAIRNGTDPTLFAKAVIKLVTEQVKADCKEAVGDIIRHNYNCIASGGKVKGFMELLKDIDEA